jgi:hypothetical protein
MIIRPAYVMLLAFLLVPVVNSQSELPEGEGRLIVEDVCTRCHDLVNITDSRRSKEQWQHIVSQMIMQGSPLEEYEVDTVVEYLSKNFGKKNVKSTDIPEITK